jgi:hypothetical protein
LSLAIGRPLNGRGGCGYRRRPRRRPPPNVDRLHIQARAPKAISPRTGRYSLLSVAIWSTTAVALPTNQTDPRAARQPERKPPSTTDRRDKEPCIASCLCTEPRTVVRLHRWMETGAIPASTSEATHAPDANEVLSLDSAEPKG